MIILFVIIIGPLGCYVIQSDCHYSVIIIFVYDSIWLIGFLEDRSERGPRDYLHAARHRRVDILIYNCCCGCHVDFNLAWSGFMLTSFGTMFVFFVMRVCCIGGNHQLVFVQGLCATPMAYTSRTENWPNTTCYDTAMKYRARHIFGHQLA